MFLYDTIPIDAMREEKAFFPIRFAIAEWWKNPFQLGKFPKSIFVGEGNLWERR